MLLFPESGPKKNFRINGFTKTVAPHLRSIVPNVQRHMTYFASLSLSLLSSLPPPFPFFFPPPHTGLFIGANCKSWSSRGQVHPVQYVL
jgi:hypothetical protein